MARAKEKQIIFDIAIDPNISECIKIDLLRIQQVISNLIGNAIKFTPEHGKLSLYVKMLDKADEAMQLRIGVKDSGIGISKENQKHIFEAFSQADGSTTRNFGGTGLGLTISGHLVSFMGGSLQVESEEGAGSDFFFDIPVKTCENKHSLSKLFSHLKLNIISESEHTGLCREKVLVYLDTMDIHYKISASNTMPEILNENEVYVLFCNSPKALLERLIDQKIKTIIACDDVEHKITAKNITQVCDLEHNLSVLYNVLFETAMSYNQDISLDTNMDNKQKSYKGSVLIAEDNEVNQLLIKEMLVRYHLEPVIVVNGQEAVREASQNQYDLILMDANMPIMGGIEALHLIKEKGILTPVVALTANAMEGDKEKFMGEGFDQYLTKPIIVKSLENVLDIYLKQDEDISLVLDSKTSEINSDIVSSADKHVNMDLIKTQLPFPDKVLHKLFQSFIETYPKHLASLKLGIGDLDFTKIEQEAHALKGAAGNLRIKTVDELTAKIESAGREQKEIDYELSFKELEKMLEAVKMELKEMING